MDIEEATIEEQVFGSASNGDVLVLAHLLSAVDPNICDQYGVTPLMDACRFGRLACVRVLVEKGAKVNSADKEKATVLMHACSGESSGDIIEFLIGHGAKCNKRDAYGCTALMRAASNGNIEIVKTLLRNGAKVNVQSDNDETPLTFAIVWGHLKAVEALIHAKADVNWTDKSGWTPLRYALHEKQNMIARLLQDHGAKLSISHVAIGKRVAGKTKGPLKRKKG